MTKTIKAARLTNEKTYKIFLSKKTNKIFLSIILFASMLALSAQEAAVGERQVTPNIIQLTAREIRDAALKKGKIQDAISYTKEKLGSKDEISDETEIRSLYIFLGGLEESSGLYQDAKVSYIKAAAIAGKDAEGMTARSNEMLVLDAVRMSLATGEGNEALTFLSSAVRNTKDENVRALIKLYEIWAALCLEQTTQKEDESIRTLKQYVKDPLMKPVRLNLLFTLWYITGDLAYAEEIVASSPDSNEAAVVKGISQIMPSPFWYFIPHNRINTLPKKPGAGDFSNSLATPNTTVDTKVSGGEKTTTVTTTSGNSTKKTTVTVKTTNNGPESISGYIPPTADIASSDSVKVEIPIKEQLGLFRDKSNALNYVEKLKAKGFSAYISEVVKASGNTYFTVFVDEDPAGSIGLKLKSAGFECYPIYK